ncbi:MAG: CDP-alcohol phosphatidyltransferase family protein [Candidatus Omnitrophota bacterium]
MRLTFANKVTIGRIIIVPFFIVAMVYYRPNRDYFRTIALGIFLLAVLTDIIDGYIARTLQEKTKAGAILDPLADKLLLISAFICLYRVGPLLGSIRFPFWLVIAVISRDTILLVGSLIIYVMHGALDISPTAWGKTTTFFQIICVFGVLLQSPLSIVLWIITAVLTVISGVDYIRSGIKVLNAPVENHS